MHADARPFMNKKIWDEEAVICRDLGVPID